MGQSSFLIYNEAVDFAKSMLRQKRSSINPLDLVHDLLVTEEIHLENYKQKIIRAFYSEKEIQLQNLQYNKFGKKKSIIQLHPCKHCGQDLPSDSFRTITQKTGFKHLFTTACRSCEAKLDKVRNKKYCLHIVQNITDNYILKNMKKRDKNVSDVSKEEIELRRQKLIKKRKTVEQNRLNNQDKKNKIVHYVLFVSEKFLHPHKRTGQETGFVNAIQTGEKIHTIRLNYSLWKKRFEKINAGKAVLVMKVWEGKPYGKGSSQKEVFRFDKSHGIGVEKILFDDYLYSCLIENRRVSVGSEMIQENDGLSPEDFEEWFKGYDLTQEMAIIHFTDFRYAKN